MGQNNYPFNSGFISHFIVAPGKTTNTENWSREVSLQAVTWPPSAVFIPFPVTGGGRVKHTAEEASINMSEVLDSIPGIGKGTEK